MSKVPRILYDGGGKTQLTFSGLIHSIIEDIDVPRGTKQMFTGLIETLSKVTAVRKTAAGMGLVVDIG
ncbi:MAG: hypothetical protein Q7T18_05265, partial [Sedimentisphaerales bacterium]|nr:hypothetical protein [Sedimentisphaerales bacterium]